MYSEPLSNLHTIQLSISKEMTKIRHINLCGKEEDYLSSDGKL